MFRGLGVSGVGLRVQGFSFKVWGLGFSSGFPKAKVRLSLSSGVGCRVWLSSHVNPVSYFLGFAV